jgi:uncharacterized protein
MSSLPPYATLAHPRAPAVTLITIPGLHGSESAHWQSWLEDEVPGTRRVEQRDWSRAHLGEWSRAIRDVLIATDGPLVLAAHSFGCLASAHALSHGDTGAFATRVLGVLFVAPASPARFTQAGAFGARRLELPSLVVGSETDPWMPLDEARSLAQRWNSAFVNLGDAGHINTSAGFGPWPLARHLVETLARRITLEEEDTSARTHAYG